MLKKHISIRASNVDKTRISGRPVFRYVIPLTLPDIIRATWLAVVVAFISAHRTCTGEISIFQRTLRSLFLFLLFLGNFLQHESIIARYFYRCLNYAKH